MGRGKKNKGNKFKGVKFPFQIIPGRGISKKERKEFPPNEFYQQIFKKGIEKDIRNYVFNPKQWKEFYEGKYQKNIDARRKMRKIVQIDTIYSFLKGGYVLKDEETIEKRFISKKDIIKSIKTSKLYGNDYSYRKKYNMVYYKTQEIDEQMKEEKKEKEIRETEVIVVNGDCVDTIIKLNTQKKEKLNPVLLINASKNNAGGGFEKGAAAQEEAICRSSNLFMCLEDQYKFCSPRKVNFYPLQEFGSVYIPACLVIRYGTNQGYKYLEKPLKISMLNQYCYAHPPLSPNGEIEGGRLRRDYQKKIYTILNVALENGHDSIVLTAFGSGVYKNPPSEIARFFKIALNQKRYKNNFKYVVFSIIGSKANLNAYSKVFEKKPITLEELFKN